LGFSWEFTVTRKHETSRLEAFSNAVFGFALALPAVSASCGARSARLRRELDQREAAPVA
jgi:hypothetical protein